MGVTIAATPSPPAAPANGGGGYFAKRKKPHSEYIREAVEALLAMEAGTAEYVAARSRLKVLSEKQGGLSDTSDDNVILMFFVLDLL